jgi:hypothetical protein
VNNSLGQKRRELLEYHTANGFINVRKLLEGVKILIKTLDEVYEFEVATPAFGVVLMASDRRFERRDKATLSGSLDIETNIFLREIIGEGLKILLRLPQGRIIHTNPVVSAKVKGINYEYVLWESE